MTHRFMVILAAVLMVSVVAAAQELPRPPVDPKACDPQERATLGSGPAQPLKPNENEVPGGNVSDKLARTEGVICPPANVDPDIHAPVRGGGAMPVIPPPGSPGGDPSVRPK